MPSFEMNLMRSRLFFDEEIFSLWLPLLLFRQKEKGGNSPRLKARELSIDLSDLLQDVFDFL